MEHSFKHHEPLYLKYRPQSLGQLVGQEAVVQTLSNAIEHNKLCHAYLFTGPRGTGKTSSARILAKSLNCKSIGRPTTEPCQTCSCCLEITAGNSPAVLEIDAASNNSVDDARILIERAPLKAFGGEFKIYIIDECHMLTKEAFNALLKTIEQPPPSVVFILATTEEHKVLPTIVSRCQRLMFRLINQEALSKHLAFVAKKESIEIEQEAIELIARRSAGGLRDALGTLEQASLLASPNKPVNVKDLLYLLGALHEDILLSISEGILERNGQTVLNLAEQLLSEGREPALIVQELSRHFLYLMKASYLCKEVETGSQLVRSTILGSSEYISGLFKQAPLYDRVEISQIVERLDHLEIECRRSTQATMHLEIGLLSICHRQEMILLKDLVERVSALENKHFNETSLKNTEIQQKSNNFVNKPQIKITESNKRESESKERESKERESKEREGLDNEIKRINSTKQQEIETHFEKEAESNSENIPETITADLNTNSKVSELNSDIDYLWSQILDELQRKHLPTFSLASTHAFPLQINEQEFSIGVLKENFQKMLENKIEHLKAASESVTGMSLTVRIRVSDNSSAASQKKSQTSTKLSKESTEKSNNSYSKSSTNGDQSELSSPLNNEFRKEEASLSEEVEQSVENSSEFDSTMVKEAHKLFDGPGSRRIT